MFRRRRFPFRRRSTFGRRRFRPFAARVRPKYDRVVLFNTLQGDWNQGETVTNPDSPGLILPCGPIVLPHCNGGQSTNCAPCVDPPCQLPTCCSTQLTLRLISNSILESYFQDRVTVVRLFGDIWCRTSVFPQGVGTDLCSPSSQAPGIEDFMIRYAEEYSVSLRKFGQTEYPYDRDSVSTRPSSFLDESTPMVNYDWSEARWLWQRYRWWRPTPEMVENRTVSGSIQGCCPDVTGGSLLNPLELGTGNIDTSVTTSCNPCQPTSEGGCLDLRREWRVRLPPTHHFRLGVKRHIALRADENLDLQIGVRHPTAISEFGGSTGWGCGDQGASNGTEADVTNYYIHARIGAILRLN